jgi:hypothetical protein
MDIDAGQRRGSRVNQPRSALGLGLALVSGLSASLLRVPDAPTTIACYAALANDLTPVFEPTVPGAAHWSTACPSP